MKLNDRILNGEELLQDFVLGAEERFVEAQSLLAGGHATGATYLVGYVAEMILKHAIFRFDGAKPGERVYPRLAPAKKWAKVALPAVRFNGYHDVLFWAHVLRKKRADRGSPLAPTIESNMMRIAYRIRRSWAVDLRYFGGEVGVEAAQVLLADVAWLRKNQLELQR